MRKRMFKTAAALSILFFMSLNLHAQEAYSLKYKYEKGKSYQYNYDMTSKLTQEVMGKEIKVDSDIHNILTFNVEDVTGGDINFVTTIDSAVLHNTAMGKENTMDLTDLIGKRCSVVMSDLGVVKNSSMIDTLDEKYAHMAPISEELKQFFTRLSSKDVKTGGSWNYQDVDTIKNLGDGVTRNLDVTATLAGKETMLGISCLKIPFTGKFKISGKANLQGMDFTVEGDGTISGTMYLGSKSKVMVERDLTMSIEMTLATSGQQSMVIPITQEIATKQTLINK